MKHILLIEENLDHAELIERTLKKGLGPVKIDLSENSKKALKLLEAKDYHLILSDFYLPDSKGVDHIRRLAKHAPDTPIIIITGQGDEKTAAKSIKAGADDYIVKTRNALNALPRILNRTFAKHQSNLKKKKNQIHKHLKEQKLALQKVLEEVEVIEKKIQRLQQLAPPAPRSKSKKDDKTLTHFTLDGLIQQVNGLKSFVYDLFKSDK